MCYLGDLLKILPEGELILFGETVSQEEGFLVFKVDQTISQIISKLETILDKCSLVSKGREINQALVIDINEETQSKSWLILMKTADARVKVSWKHWHMEGAEDIGACSSSTGFMI